MHGRKETFRKLQRHLTYKNLHSKGGLFDDVHETQAGGDAARARTQVQPIDEDDGENDAEMKGAPDGNGETKEDSSSLNAIEQDARENTVGQGPKSGDNKLIHLHDLLDPTEMVGRRVSAYIDLIAMVTLPAAYCIIIGVLLAEQDRSTPPAGTPVTILHETGPP